MRRTTPRRILLSPLQRPGWRWRRRVCADNEAGECPSKQSDTVGRVSHRERVIFTLVILLEFASGLAVVVVVDISEVVGWRLEAAEQVSTCEIQPCASCLCL